MQEHVQVDSSKCKACRRCEFACIASHHGIDIKTAMKMKDTYSPRCWAVKGDTFKTSVRCHNCNPAPCCAICPTGALEQHSDGTFAIHPELCAGCMMCMNVCPYGVISPETIAKETVADTLSAADKEAIAVRCDLCADWRAEKGVAYTACMEACAARALVLVKADGTLIEAPVVAKKAAKPQPKAVPAPKAEEVKAEPEAKAQPEAKVEEAKAKPEAKAEEVKAEPKAKAEEAKAEPEAKPEAKVEEVKAEPEAKAEEVKAEPKAKATEQKVEDAPAPEAEQPKKDAAPVTAAKEVKDAKTSTEGDKKARKTKKKK